MRCPGSTSASGGSSWTQISPRNRGQRVWKTQPEGGLAALGISPSRRMRVRSSPSSVRHRGEERLRVGVVRAAEDRLRVADLLQAAEVHDRDPVGDVADDAEVVRDEDVAHAFLRLQLDEEVEDRRLHRDVERRRGLVAEDDARLARERARDRHALLEAAGELRGLGAEERLVEAHRLGELGSPARPCSVAVQPEELVERAADDAAHGVAAVERAVGVLEDDLERAHLLLASLLDLARERLAVHVRGSSLRPER